MLDAKWLDVLKAGGPKAAAAAVAMGIFVLLLDADHIPGKELPWLYPLSVLGFLIFACVSVASICTFIFEECDVVQRIKAKLARRRGKKRVEALIPFMTDEDKAIIGYLLHHNQRIFSTDDDGGRAAHLISQGVIQMAVAQGQIVRPDSVPFEILDHAWDVLTAHRDHFPYVELEDDDEFPWAINWMAR